MDQVQNADPNVTQDLISRLTKEVTDLRNENARLQVWSDRVLPNGYPYNMTRPKLNRVNWAAPQRIRKMKVTALRRVMTTS